MIYVVDVETGERVAEVMGELSQVGQSFLNERRCEGRKVSLVNKPYGYLIEERLPTGKLKGLLEIRTKPPVDKKKMALNISLGTVIIVLGIVIFVTCAVIDRLLGLEPSQKNVNLLNPLGLNKGSPLRLEFLLAFFN
jgi:hypothetical protein